MSRSILPKSDKELALVMRSHGDREMNRMAARFVRWQWASLYMSGERRFSIVTPWGTTLRMEEMEADENTVPMHIETLVSIHNKVIGLLNGLDLRPYVQRDDTTLAAIRDRAVAQVVLDSAMAGQHVDEVKRMFLHYFSMLGSAGLHSQVADMPNVGLTGQIEVVHPREIYPWPSVGGDLGKITGKMRDRWVPWFAIQDAFGIKSLPDGVDIETERRLPGESDREDWGASSWSSVASRETKPGESPKKDKREELWIKLKELWIDGPRGTVSDYVASSGDKILGKESFRDTIAFSPLTFKRFYESGDFHGAGVYDLIFSCVREFEKLVRDFVANVKEADKFSTMILPAGTIDEKKFFSDNRSNVRVLTVDPEPKGVFGTQAQVLRPTVVSPPNAGDLPGRTASFLLNIIKDLAPIRDIIDDKGRVDSFSGLQFLQDEAQRPIANPVSSLVEAFGEAYRYVASQAFNLLADSPRPIPVGRLTIDLVGAVIDPMEATLSFANGTNSPPDISRLRFSVKQTSLKMLAARKSEAVELLKMQVKDRIDFLIHAVQEGLDYAMYLDPERSAYESLMGQIITLYGDGETPGEDERWGGILSAPYLENPEFQLRILNAFMTSPAMRVASVEVIEAFMEYRETLIGFTGKMLPVAMPDPYTNSVMQAAQMVNGGATMNTAGGSPGAGGQAGGPPAARPPQRGGGAGSGSKPPGPPKPPAKR